MASSFKYNDDMIYNSLGYHTSRDKIKQKLEMKALSPRQCKTSMPTALCSPPQRNIGPQKTPLCPMKMAKIGVHKINHKLHGLKLYADWWHHVTEKISTCSQLQTFLLYNGMKTCFEITWLHGTLGHTNYHHMQLYHPLAESLQFLYTTCIGFSMLMVLGAKDWNTDGPQAE